MRRGQTTSVRESHRWLLRVATQDLHDETERTWSTPGGFRSRDQYIAFLGAIRAVHIALGLPSARLIGAEEEITEEIARVRTLSKDLGDEPARVSPDRILSESFAWGVAYGLNGSTLGASVLLKAGHCQEGWPSAYLRRGRDYARSGRLVRFFEALDTADIEVADAVAGAREVFARLASAPAVKSG